MQYSNPFLSKTTITDTDITTSYDNTGGVKTSWLNVFLNYIKVKTDLLYPAKKSAADTQITFWDGNSGDLQGDTGLTFDKTQKVVKISGSKPIIQFEDALLAKAYIERDTANNSLKIVNKVLQAGGIGKGLKLNGTNSQYFSVGGGTIINGVSTISFWFKCSIASGGLFYNGGVNGATNKIRIFRIYSNTSVLIEIDNAGSGSVLVNPSTFGITVLDNNWHFVAMCQESTNTMRTYIDNILVGSFNGSSPLPPTYSPFNIGYDSNGGSNTYFTGSVDQFCVFNSALTVGQVSTMWNSGAGTFTLPIVPIRRFDFEEGIGTTVNESISNVNITVQNSGTGVGIWDIVGKVPSEGLAIDSISVEITNGLTNTERGVHKFGDYFGRTVIQGSYTLFRVSQKIPIQIDKLGKITIDSDNTDDTLSTNISTNPTLPTAKFNIGPSLIDTAQLRLFSGSLNTSNINLGDYNHITSQRTIFKRKGSSTANSLWLSDSDTHFTQTDTKNVSNTITPTSIIGTLVSGQTLTYPANFWVSGKMEEIEIEGVMSIVNTDNFNIDITLGGTNISTSGSLNTGTSTMVDMNFKLSIKIKCETVGTTGTFRTTGTFYTFVGTYNMTKVGTTVINTTISQLLDAKITFSVASTGNSITSYNSRGLILN